jgi:ABC-type lipoprotein release transport system permease subunit
MTTGEKGEVTFPFSEAFRFSLESIRKRFVRAMITTVSIVLGIAFLVTLLTSSAILSVEGLAIPAYQIWMVAIALIVCGVGIVNSMLMAVTERYKEIGTIKCLGATDGYILEIFFTESALLGLLGGLIGAIIGLLAALLTYGSQLGWEVVSKAPSSIYLYNFGVAIGAALLLSVIGTIYPAYYAAKLDPATALRYEV